MLQLHIADDSLASPAAQFSLSSPLDRGRPVGRLQLPAGNPVNPPRKRDSLEKSRAEYSSRGRVAQEGPATLAIELGGILYKEQLRSVFVRQGTVCGASDNKPALQ